MRIGALVPARIGSKRLPRKNILELGGKPMICRTLDPLLESGMFSDVTVSTESPEVADVVREHYPAGDVNVLMRPDQLARGDSPLSGVQAHYLEARPDLDWHGLFMPTYPFRSVARLREIHAAILSNHAWRVQTVTTQTAPIMDYYYPAPGGHGVKRFFNEPNFFARHLLSTYLLSRCDAAEHLWNAYGLSAAERTYYAHASVVEAIDVDTAEDFEDAQKVAAGLVPVPRRLVAHRVGTDLENGWNIVAPEGTDFAHLVEQLGHRLEDADSPLLVLDVARPPVNFLLLQDGCQRRPWISPEAAQYLHSEEAQRTGDMARLPLHYRHAEHLRVQRVRRAQTREREFGRTDEWGGFQGLDGSVIPRERIVMLDELEGVAPATDWIQG